MYTPVKHLKDIENSLRIDGLQIKRLRRMHGWTQEDLAVRTGYCERWIRKAEAGEPMSLEATRAIADALSTPHHVVSIEDLLFSPSVFISTFYKTLLGDADENDLIKYCDESIGINDSGSASNILWGHFQGSRSFGHWVKELRIQLSIVDHPDFPIIAVDRNHGFMSVLAIARSEAIVPAPKEFMFRFHFGKTTLQQIVLLSANLESQKLNWR